MCNECSKGLFGKPKKAKIGEHGYSDGKTFDSGESLLKEHTWKGIKVAAGTTAGYVIAKTVEESVETLRDNRGIAAVAQLATGMIGKQLLPINQANGIFDNICNGFTTRGGVNLFRGLAEGFANKYNIHGKQLLNRFRGFVPSMPQLPH